MELTIENNIMELEMNFFLYANILLPLLPRQINSI